MEKLTTESITVSYEGNKTIEDFSIKLNKG